MEIAEQLSAIDYEMFAKLTPNEFYNQNWVRPKSRHKASNVSIIADRATSIAEWLRSMVMSLPDLERRWKLISKFIRIADALYQIGNFNSLMSILSGLNYGAILRLKNTYAELDPAIKNRFDFLNDLMSNSLSYKKYRNELKSRTGFCLPFLGIILTDLTFIDDGNNDFVDSKDKKIN